MKDDNNSIEISFYAIAITILIIFFKGEPDIVDSIIAVLQKIAGN